MEHSRMSPEAFAVVRTILAALAAIAWFAGCINILLGKNGAMMICFLLGLLTVGARQTITWSHSRPQ